MQRRALLIASIFVLLTYLGLGSVDIGHLQQNGFYMVGSEGNTLTLYGIDCNAEINTDINAVTVHHTFFEVFSETNGFPDVSCDENAIHIINALNTTILRADCNPDVDALPKTVVCGEGCKIAEATPFENNGWFIHLVTWGYPDQVCLDGRCTAYGGTSNEFNLPAHEGNNDVTIVCGTYMDSRTVFIAPKEVNVSETNAPAETNATTATENAPTEVNIPEKNAPEVNAPVDLNGTEINAAELNTLEANVPAEINALSEVNAELNALNVKSTSWIRLGPVRIKLKADVNAYLEGDYLVIENNRDKRVGIRVEPLDPMKKYYAINSRGKIRSIPGRLTAPAHGKERWKIIENVPAVKKVGKHYVIQSSRTVTVDINADSFQVAPTNVPGAPGTIIAMFSFEKNVPVGGSVKVRISVPGENIQLWKFDGKTWTPIEFNYSNGWAEYVVEDNGPLDQDPTPGRIVDDVAVGTGGLTIYAYLDPQITRPGTEVRVYGKVEKNGTAVANNWINIYLDGNRLGGPTVLNGPSDWWDPNWKYRREINISNGTGVDLNNIQVRITLDLNALYSEGKLNRDASDLRFVTPDGNVLNYWIESVEKNIVPIPRSSDDTNALTADAVCDTNPQYKYYDTIDPDGSAGTAEEPPGWYLPDFNDDSWLIGSGPLGNTGGECTPALQTEPGDLFVRKWFEIPGEPIEGKLKLSIGGGVRCYVNGTLVIDELNVATEANYWNYTVDLNTAVLKEGDNLLACWVADGGENPGGVSGYFDAEVDVNYYERILPDANVWVLVPNIPAGGTKIYMYYGNPNAVPVESYDNTFPTYNLAKDCSGTATAGCSVTFNPTADIGDGNYVFFEDQRYGYGSIDFLMSGDFDYGGAYADPTTCNTGGYERVAVYLNAICYGTYSTGYQDCTDREPATWPKDIGTFISGQQTLTAEGDPDAQVNYDPGCGYFYHFVWAVNAKVRKTASPEPTATVGPEIMDTQTDALGEYSWTFTAPDTVGEHSVRVDVNDGTDFVSITVPLYVTGGMKIYWADTLPRVQTGYKIYVKSNDANITEVNANVSDLNGTYSKTVACTASGTAWLCDVNTYEINDMKYLIRVYGYDSGGNLVGFDAKYSQGGPHKAEEFATYRDVNSYSSVIINPYEIRLQGILAGFSYRVPITINNSSGPEYNSFPVKVVVDTAALIAAGKMKSDCSDVRFTDDDGATELPYWLERGCNTSSTVFWVRVPNIPAGGTKKIYMYYGNPRAPSGSDGSKVFDFFDNFEEWNGWVQYGLGTVTQSGAEKWDGSYSLLKTDNSDPNGGYKDLGFDLNYPFVLEAEIYRLNYNGGQWDRVGVIDANGNGYGFVFQHNTPAVAVDVRNAYTGTATATTVTANPYQVWYHAKLVWEGNGTIIAEAYDANGTFIGRAEITDTSYSSFTRVYVFGGYDYYVDDIRIYPYVQNPPTATVGTEETVPTITYSGTGSWLGSFSYRDIVDIYNNSTEDLSNYQVKVVVDTAALIAAGKMKSDCSDVRFTDDDGATELPYWLERGCNTSSTVFWVRVPNIPAGGTKKIYMYYGDPTATSASDPAAVFDYWDGMETWIGWTQYGSGIVAQATPAWEGSYSLRKYANNDPNGGYKDLGFDLNYPFVLEAEVNRYAVVSGGYYDRVGVIDANGNGYGAVFLHNGPAVGVDVRSSYTGTVTSSPATKDINNQWYTLRLIWNDGTITAQAETLDGNVVGAASITDTSYSSFTRVYVFGGQEYLVDAIRIRKYVNPEPKAVVQTYEPRFAPSGYVEFNAVMPIEFGTWTYLDVNTEDIRDTNVHIVIKNLEGNVLCSFDVIPTITRYDISGCTGDTNVITIRAELSTYDGSVTPILKGITVHWQEKTNIKLVAPTDVYQFRNELMEINGWLTPTVSGCTDVNAYLYYKTKGSPRTIEEYNYDQFITRSYDSNVYIGDNIHPAYLHPTLGYYVRDINVSNPAGVALYNYPVKITINTAELIAAGQMRSDCGDIRITDANYNELNYWVRPGTCDTTATEIWVSVPVIPASGTVLHLFHGNLNLISLSNGDAVFPDENVLVGSCSGSTPGGSCSVTLAAPSGYVFAPYQPNGYAELNMAMSGDFDYGGAYSNPTICDTGTYERAYFVLDNSWCLGTYTTGYQDCTDRTPAGWPINIADLIVGDTNATISAYAGNQVNYDPGCGYYYHYAYSMKVKLRKYVFPEPTVTVPANSRPDVAPVSYYVSDALDTGETSPIWGEITWDANEPAYTSVKVYVRTSSDGATWSDWYEVQNGDTIPAPRAEYIEYNVMFYVFKGATDYPSFDNLKIIYYHGVPVYTLATATDLTLSTSDPNPFRCGAVALGSYCYPDWNAVPKDRGEYFLMMHVTSDCGFEGNSNEKIIYVFAKTAILNFASDKNVVAKGDSFTVSGKVVDELGNPVARRPVRIYDGNLYLGETLTADDGTFSFTYTVPTTASLGYHTIRAIFPRDGVEFYWESEASTTVKYSSKPVISYVSVSPETAGIGDTVAVSAEVTDEVGLSSVTLDVTDPNGTAYSYSMNCSGTICSYDFNETWVAGAYTYKIVATNLDGITSDVNGTFNVEGYATFGAQAEHETYGALEDVLQWNGEYWGDPLSTYSSIIDGNGISGRDLSITTVVPRTYDPFNNIQSYDFVRLDGDGFNVSYGTGVDGNALVLSGNGGVVIPTTTQILPKKGITITAWARIDSNVGDRYLISVTDSAGNPIYAIYSPNGDTNVCMEIRSGGTAYTTCSPALTTGTWHFIVGSFDGETVRIYVDGSLAGYTSLTTPGPIDYSNVMDIAGIGTEFNGTTFTNGWVGAIDDLMIYPAQLTESEMDKIRNGQLLRRNPNGYWKFDNSLEDSNPHKENALRINNITTTDENITVLVPYLGVKNSAAVSGATGVQGVEGNAAYFNGAATITYTTSDFDDANMFSAMFWIYPEANAGTILNKGYNNSPSWKIDLSPDGRIVCTVRTSAGVDYNVISSPIPSNTWTHVACVYDHIHLTVYLNGAENNSITVNYFGGIANTYNLVVGSGFTGRIDDLRIYRFPVSARDVYNTYKGIGADWGLVLYQSFDSNTWDDESNDWTFTLYSGGWPHYDSDDAATGTAYTIPATIIKVWKRAAICNTGETNVAGYLYVDVQSGAGTTWSTVPPVTINDAVSGTRRTIAPGTCLDVASIYNANPWNTSDNPAGTYRIRMAFLRPGGSPGNTADYIKTSEGKIVTDWDEFNIVSTTLTVSDINHTNLALYNLNEYETTDDINWIDVYVTARNSAAVDTYVTLTLTDAYQAYAGFGPNNETVYYGTIAKDATAVERWDNGGVGYYIPPNASPGTYQFHWLVEMNAANGPTTEDFTRFVVIHNLPYDFNSSAPTRIYYYSDQNNWGTYQFCMINQWSREINNVSVTINCPSGVGIICEGVNSGTITETLPSIAAGASACFDFNIIVTPSAVTGDYNFDVNVSYTNPAGNVKHWNNVQRRVIEIRKAGILEILLPYYDVNAIRGEENVVFISKAHNTGTVNDDNAWIAYTYPSDWVVAEKNTDGTFVGAATDVNAFKATVAPDANIELNVVFSVPADANLGPRLVRITTSTATDPTWGDFKNVYVTVWDRPDMNFSASDYNASVGESINLYVHLTYSDGTPIANQRINFDKNGVPLGAADTNADGWAVYTWDLTYETPGTYLISAVYDGNDTIYTIPTERNITVNIGLPPDVNAAAYPDNVGYGLDVTIEANASDDQGIKAVWATIRDPKGVENNVTLSLVTGNIYRATFQPWIEGNYTITVYAQDLYDSITAAPPLTVTAEANVAMGVETDKNFYLQGEAVRLKSPEWWNIAWKYRVPILIKNSTLTDLNNYQVRISVDTNALAEAGKIRRDLGDIRFVTPGGTELNYWWQEVNKTAYIIPRASDDTDPTTADAVCDTNPEYKYYYCSHPCEPIGWYTESFDDSSWLTGYAPFGDTGGQCTTVLSAAPDDLFVRKWFEIPGEPLEANLMVASDDGVECYINGKLVINDINSSHAATYWNYNVDVTADLNNGKNLLACWVANGGENNGTGTGYFDAALLVKYRAYLDPDANFWVVIPFIPADGNTIIYMYYGNPDATSESNAERVFTKYSGYLDCAGSVAGGSCSVTFLSENNAVFAPYQRGAELNFLMSGDFDTGGAFSDPTVCTDDGTNERVTVYLNGTCYGSYSTGYQDCIDRTPAGWPIDVSDLIRDQNDLTATGDAWIQVNYDPGCGYYYHFAWELNNAYVRQYVSPEPSATLGNEETIGGSYIIPGRTFKGYLLGIIERNVSGVWTYVDTDLNDLASGILRTFTANTLLDLSTVWNDWNTYGQPQGTYRAVVRIVGPDGNALTQNGVPMEEYNIFQIGPPPVDVSISAFRVYDVNGVADPRTEGNLVDSGLEKTIYVSADRKYRIEFDVTVSPTSNDWNIADSNVWMSDLNADWNVLDVWYTLPTLVDQNGGTFDGNVYWDTNNDGTAGASQTVTFHFIVDLNTLHAEEHNTTITVTHPAFIKRSDWVVLQTYVPDVFPPVAVEYNLLDLNTGEQGWEINAIRGQTVKIFAEWNEPISDAYVEYNGTTSALTTATITPDGNYTEYNFATTSFWLLGPHVAKIHAADLSGNWNHDLNFLTFVLWGIANVSSIDLNDTNVYIGDPVEVNCTVVDPTNGNNPVANYPVHFYDNGTPIGTAYTNSSGIASIVWTPNTFGEHVLECNVETNAEMWYTIDPPNNEKNITILIKETVPPSWSDANAPTKVHRGETFETNVLWWDNDKIDTVVLKTGIDFRYRIPITISNAGTTTLSDYQVLVTVDTNALISAGKMRPDCGDIRFYQGNTKLPYWIEGGCDTNNTRIWVRVPSIPSGESTIYMYYGNPDATSESNGFATFDFFDDFENWSGWTQYGSGIVEQNCTLSFEGSCSLHKIANNDPNGGYKDLGFDLNYPFVLEAFVYRPSTYAGGSFDRIGVIDASGNGYGMFFDHSTPAVGTDIRSAYAATANSTTVTINPLDSWYRLSMVWDNGSITTTAETIDGGLIGSNSITDSNYSSFTRAYVFGGYDYYVDDLRIRKYASPEPTTTVGTEEMGPQEVNSIVVDANNVYVTLSWTVPADEPLGPHLWLQEANDPSGNITDTNMFEFNVWGWAFVSASSVNPTAVAPGGEVNAYCQVKDYTLGTPLSGYTVYFEIEGNYLGSAETNADGWAMLEFNAPSATGLYNVTCWIEANAERFYDPYPDKNSATNLLNVTLSSDTDPPDAVSWELNDLNRTSVNVAGDTTGADINVIRGDDINFWAIWDENLSSAWIETNTVGTTTVTFNATVDGNYADGIIETNADWARGKHYATMYALDEANNPSIDANSAHAYYTVWVFSDVKWVSPVGTVSQSEYNLTCFVYEDDTNAGIPGYTVAFYDNINGYLGSATTDASGYARLLADFNTYAYGSYYFWCQIADWPAEYYKANVDQDGTTINVAAVNLKAVYVDVNTDSNTVKEGDPVLVEGNVWNQYDAVDANVDIIVQRWTGTEWNTVDQNRYFHPFASDENATFTYLWTAVPGRYRFILAADPDNTVDEENEADNNVWTELNVPTWATLYGDVNGIDVLGATTYLFYKWAGTGNGVEIFYDADVTDMNVDELEAMKTVAEINRADYVLGTNGNPDCILCKYDANGDGIIDAWHVFDIAGRSVNAPVFYVDGWPVGILYENNNGATAFDGTQPIVFVTEIYDNQACTYSSSGVCDYVVQIPSPLKRQFGTTDEIKIQVVR